MKKVALITGSTSGIGKAIAHKFAEEGFNVAISGFGGDAEIAAQIQGLKALNIEAMHFHADLTKAADCAQLIANVFAHFGRLDVLVNNAGMQYVAPIDQFPDEIWEKVISLDLSSNFYMMKHALPIMREQKWGRIINIASAHGLVASEDKSAYVAAKHGLVGLTKVVALETALENITCNAICPGFVYTPLVEAQIQQKAAADNMPFEDAKEKFVAAKHPSKRFVEMNDVAELAFFLSRDCAKEIRGASYVMDGGWCVG